MLSIQQLMDVPEPDRKLGWLQDALQKAIELELFTIPPYLCALWSIIKPVPTEPVYSRIRRIVRQEMLHMGFACNMLTTTGAVPQVNTPTSVPKYPRPLRSRSSASPPSRIWTT